MPEPYGSNVTLFTHQDGKKFQVTIVRLDETAEIDSEDAMGTYREEDWDSDDWDEDAEDLEEPTPQPVLQPQAQMPLYRAVREEYSRTGESLPSREDQRTVDDWDGDAQDLEEQPAAKWSERPDRPDWVRRQRDADVWRTRLGED